MSERAKRAIEYLEEDASVARLEAMGLSATELGEVLSGLTSGDRVPDEVLEAVERLYDARRAAEEEAGLAVPVVTLKPESEIPWTLIGWLAAAAALGGAAWILLR